MPVRRYRRFRRPVIRRRVGGLRRRFRRTGRKRAGRPSTLTLRTPSSFPDRLKVKLAWEQEYKCVISAGATTYGFVYGNDIKQPDGTSTHKPYVSDKWGALYKQYVVHGSSIVIRPSYDSTTTAGGWLGLIPHPTVTASGPSTPFPFGESPYCKQIALNAAAGGQKGHILKHYMSTAKAFGMPKRVADADRYEMGGNTSSASGGWTDPLNQWLWTFAAIASSTTATPTYYFFVKVVFYVEFWDRVDLSSAT